ncbi:MAG: IS3 family transposase [Leptolyngbyaceae cyanobacterium SL_5_9]|nr:IS3 family transposase [Leptolyngbyaceae cyanobacterium SL_5_9]NJO72844.1 IS3 family transposase [Leptolyngbyaceae cyanobacterium RM1_406_9]
MAANRRQYSAEFKAKVVLQVLSGEKTSSDLCRAHKLNPNVLNRWRKEFLEQAPSIFERGEVGSEHEQKIGELERLVGQLTVQLEIGKKSIKLLEPGQRWEAVMQLSQKYPVVTLCEVLNYPRSQIYYEPQSPVDETEVKAAIVKLCGRHPTYGYRRRISAMLKRQGYEINHKRVTRLMRELGLMGKPQVKRKCTTNSTHASKRYPNLVMNLAIERPDQVWVGDITYIRLQQEFVYLSVLTDVLTRSIRGWHLARSMDVSLTITALNKGLAKGRPEIHHTDQGVQYAANEHMRLLQQQGVKLSMAEVGQAWQNGYAERLMRTIKEEEVDLSEYRNFTEAYEQIEQFLENVYMKKRIHSSLNYLTPDEYEKKWNEQQKKNVI